MVVGKGILLVFAKEVCCVVRANIAELQTHPRVLRFHDLHPRPDRAGGVVEHCLDPKSTCSTEGRDALAGNPVDEVRPLKTSAHCTIEAVILPEKHSSGARAQPFGSEFQQSVHDICAPAMAPNRESFRAGKLPL